MKHRQASNSVVHLSEAPQELQLKIVHRKNFSMKLSNLPILGQSEKTVPSHNQVLPSKRFPKEVFMPPISTHRKVATNETVSLRPLGGEQRARKKPLVISTADVLHSPRVQLMKTLTSHDLGGRLDLPPLASSIFSPVSLCAPRLSARHKSNQGINLEMAFKSKLAGVITPRVEVDMEGLLRAKKSTPTSVKSNTGGVRLRPIQRTVHSSQGGTIKILLPRNFVTGDTRPNTKEEDASKISPNASSAKSHVPAGVSSFLNKVIESSRLDSRRNAEVGIRKCKNGEVTEDLCNVTFGRSEFQKGIEI